MIRLAALTAALFGLSAQAALAAEILVHDAKSSPESMAVTPDGSIYAGSASSPYVYLIKKGSTTAERFVDASGEGPGAFFLGQMADRATGTLWTCQLMPQPVPAGAARVMHTSLRGFDLKTGKEKLRWNLPGASSVCNDFSVGPDKALYISDTSNARIYRLAPGAKAADLFLENPALAGIDGITFLNGVLYVNSVSANKLFRVPVASGKAGAPVEIKTDAPIKGPDGMRAAHGKLFLAENAAGKVDALTVTGDTAHVTVIKDGLDTPTAIEPTGDTLWFSERGVGKVWSVPLPD